LECEHLLEVGFTAGIINSVKIRSGWAPNPISPYKMGNIWRQMYTERKR
jgi:hypothetical protein